MFTNANHILRNVLKGYGLENYVELLELNKVLSAYCKRALPKHFEDDIQGMYIRDGVFWIAVGGNAIAQDIQLRKQELLQELQKEEPKLKDIRCTIKRVSK